MENQIQTTIKNLLEKLGVSYESVEAVSDDDMLVFMIKTEESALLIGPQGSHLQQLNFLIKRIVEREGAPDSPFSIDINEYQKKRNDELKMRAKMFAERARSLVSNVELEPMSSYERRIVHAALSEEHGVETESSGFGRARRVVIKPAK